MAWLYTLEYGDVIVDEMVSLRQHRYPFGVAGADHAVRNDYGTSFVRERKLYTHPQSPAVDGAEQMLIAVRDVLQRAYNSAEPVCCGRVGDECCGSPDPEWSEYDQKIMGDLGPVEKWLSAMLTASGKGE